MYIISLLLFACDDPEQPPKAPGVTTHDYDGDGYTEIDGDCNDEDATVSPGSTEECDDIDNDCDGEIDNGVLTTYYADTDGDSYGQESTLIEVCTGDQPSEYIENAGDCDDTDAAVNPDATEVCDDVDNDCDGDIDVDDDSLDADSAREFFVDTDGDGFYGDTEGAEAVIACSSPDGYSDMEGDCDDANELINPDASEICDEVDNDCDGDIDDADDSLNEDSTTTFYLDVDGDTYGSSTLTEQACVQPEGYVTNSDDCDDTEENSYPEADELCDEEDNDCDGDIDEDAVDGQMWYLDVDGDGFGVSAEEFAAEGVSPISSCTMPEGYSEFDTDCDDSDATVNPDKMWYPDVDLDGNGSAFGSVQSCLQPGGYVEDATDCNDLNADLNALDADGDLETSCDGDCNDTDPLINTSGQEVCDLADADEDCDGFVNEADTVDVGNNVGVDEASFFTFYADVDADGYGKDDDTTTGCAVPDGYAELAGDCLDEDSVDGAATNPGAEEICDGINNNCDEDGLIDEDAVGGSTWYMDADFDGDGVPYTDDATPVIACDDQPPEATETHGYSLTSTDCDDSDASLNANTMWYYDIDGDTYGSTDVPPLTQCTQPVGYVLMGGDCSESDAEVYPGNLENETDPAGCYVDADNDGYGDSNPSDSNIDAGTDCDDTDAQYSPVAAWYKDNDGDTFGDETNVQFACDTVFSANNRVYVADPATADFDCNDDPSDGGASVYPNAAEVCIDDGSGNLIADGIDQNCNGVDEGNEDSDGDGTTSCAGDCDDSDAFVNFSDIDGVCGADADSDGYVSIADGGTDCDDSTGTVNPGQVETFNDGVDNDCDGNDVLISSGEGGEAAFEPGDLVITEIMHTPVDNFGSKQFFEVYNTTDLPIKLNNLQLVNGDGGTYTIDKPTDVVVAPNSYYLFVASISGSQLTVAGDGSVELTDYNEPFELTPYRGSVTIQDSSSGVVIDSVSYGFELGFTSEDGKYAQGSSIVVPYLLTDDDYALYSSNTPADWNDSAASWCVSTSAIATNDGSSGFGTPGMANDACISPTDWDNLKESTDVPNDGVPELLGDCDDTDGSEGLPANAYYQDLDGDGYGVLATETLVCNSVKATCDAYDQTLKNTDDNYDEFCATYAFNNSNECDDANDKVYLGAGYLETGTDSDGNDLSTVCMQDGDGDGFGDLSPTSSSATAGTDCNDKYSGAYPDGLTLELCNLYSEDTTDYDCDNTEESSASRCSMDTTGSFSLSGTAGEYWSNGSAKSVGDIIGGDGIDDFVVAAHQVVGDSSDADYNAGKLYFYQGPLTSASTPHMTIQGVSKNQLLGYQDINIGDVNGDSFNDIIMGAHGTHQVYIYPGKAGGFDAGDIDFEVSIPASVSIITKDDAGVYTNLGWEAEIAGDVNGDGINDLALVSRKVNNKKDGALHIYKGGLDVFPADVGITTHKLGDANELITVTRADATQKEFAESVIAMGDLNGDGFDDVAAIEEKTDGNYSDVYVFYGSANPAWDIANPDILIQNEPDIDGDGVDNYTNFKSTNIQNVGDIDGDGVNDIAIVSATSVSYQELLGEKVAADYEGVGLVVIHNNLGDSSIPVRNTYSDAWISLFNPHPDQANYNFDTLTFPWASGDVVYDSYSFGQSFTSGDLDGDGNIDFIVGGKNIDTNLSDALNEEGGAYVYYGPLMGSYDSAHAFISGSGLKDNARLGSSVNIYSSGGTNQIILVSPDVADNTDSTDVGTIYVLDSSSIDTSQ